MMGITIPEKCASIPGGTVTAATSREDQTEVALVGGGIMSATLATMLRELQPDMTIQVFERRMPVLQLDQVCKMRLRQDLTAAGDVESHFSPLH